VSMMGLSGWLAVIYFFRCAVHSMRRCSNSKLAM
jgi:hypothetical protein